MFATATVLTGPVATDSGPNVAATGEPGELAQFGDDVINSIWWQWTAPASGIVEFNTQGSTGLDGSGLDTILAVYTGSAVGALALVDANDDGYVFGFQSRVQFVAEAGTTYHLSVDGLGNAVGNIVLTVGMTPANNDIAAAAVFTGPTVNGWNLLATAEPGEVSPFDDGSPVNSVWWRWTAPTSAAIELNTVGSSFDTNLSVFTGSAIPALTQVGANDDFYGQQSRVLFTAVAGTTYHFAVDGFQESTGVIHLSLSGVVSNNLPVILDQTFSLDENSPLTTVVGAVAASDPDAGQTLTYAISGGSTTFAIDSATGQITVTNPAALDFETSPSLSLTVTVTDSGSPALASSAEVVINLNDRNDAPAFDLAAAYSIDENSAAATAVGFASVADPDAGQTLTYAIVGGNDGGAFAIDAETGRITVVNSGALDYETRTYFTLIVEATDNGSPVLTTSASVTVSVNDVNEVPLTANQEFTVNSTDGNGALVGTVSASDPDQGQTLVYTITGGNDAGAFVIDADTGRITVANAAALGTATAFTLTVLVTDNGTPVMSVTAVVAVSVVGTPENHAPVLDNTGDMSLAAVNACDSNNAGTLVSAILASAGGTRVTDADTGAVLGIAVVAADATHGTWQYSSDGGATWSPLGAVSGTAARLLAADARVRFVPAAGFSGRVDTGITFRAWDQSTGVNGGTGDATINGGSSAFSAAVETASVQVLSARQQIGLIASHIQALLSNSTFIRGLVTALHASLNTALLKLNQGNTTTAVNTIRAFTSKVQAFARAGFLSSSAAQCLIDAASAASRSATQE